MRETARTLEKSCGVDIFRKIISMLEHHFQGIGSLYSQMFADRSAKFRCW